VPEEAIEDTRWFVLYVVLPSGGGAAACLPTSYLIVRNVGLHDVGRQAGRQVEMYVASAGSSRV
jgi:hypothetical protein